MLKQLNETDAFTTVWKVAPDAALAGSADAGSARAGGASAGSASAGGEICFSAQGSFTIDWGDGGLEQVTSPRTANGFIGLSHIYKGPHTALEHYTVRISKGITKFSVTYGSADKLIEVKQWGRAQWETMGHMFYNAVNMVCTAKDTPNTSKVENMRGLFSNCYKFNAAIEHWDIKRVKSMGYMLENTPAFDQDLRQWEQTTADTSSLLGLHRSLTQYNETQAIKHAEKYAALDEKEEFKLALT